MCGIVGYVGARRATEFLVGGLRQLEYRGYDSAGLATVEDSGALCLLKAAGRIEHLETLLQRQPLAGTTGIGHTRWATHGAATDVNAHPHLGGNGTVAVVHNGVIENYLPLKEQLECDGYCFRSSTDSEVIAHLLDHCLKNHTSANGDGYDGLLEAVRATVAQLHGTYGLAILFQGRKDVLLAARLGSPLIVGVGDEEHFVASDASPLAGFTDRIMYLEDHEIALVTDRGCRVVHADRGPVSPSVHQLDLHAGDMRRGAYPHHMLKEIFEQPETVAAAMRGRLDHESGSVKFGGLNLGPSQLAAVRRLLITACGTSWHAALVGEYQIESLARIPVEVEYASELRYRNPPLHKDTLVFAVTQSGETADTLSALREMKRKGLPTLAICNVVGSTIAREADGGVYLHAGPEIGVASTKAFTSQCAVLAMLGLYFGRLHHLSLEAGARGLEQLEELPDKVRQALAVNDEVKRIALKYCDAENFLYLGRQFNFPAALEGALKLKEISYIHAEGYPAAEMKHGPIALVDAQTPSVFLMPGGPVYEKVMSNLQEIKARGGPVIAIVGPGDSRAASLADDVIEVPAVADFLQPIVSVIPLQLLAYHIAVARGCDVDKPRNLAKSVTVE
jgi:glucosamine--fructose-6-phosphate aminotransferase (isomerizing)